MFQKKRLKQNITGHNSPQKQGEVSMEKFIGTKIIEAEPMSEFSFAANRGESTPNREDQPGFMVKYPDGYISWSPEKAFIEAYRRTDNMSFGLALEAMKKGESVHLPSWQKDVKIKAQFPDKNSKMTAPYLYVESRFGKVPWKETMIELFSEDWQIVD